MDKITLLLIDDHKLLVHAWAMALNADARFRVVGETSDAEEAFRVVKNEHPQVVLADINMTPIDGFTVTKMIRKISLPTQVIGVSLYTMPGYAKRMMQAGACGYVTKNSSMEELKLAIVEASEGRRYICDEVKNILVAENFESGGSQAANSLTRKELAVIQLVKSGLSSKMIAIEMGLSVKTVEVHRYHILQKLKLCNTAALVNYMHSIGM